MTDELVQKEIWEEMQEKRMRRSQLERARRKEVCLKALQMVTRIDHFDKEQERKLLAYIRRSMERIHCCVLWNRSDEFRSLLTSVGIDSDSLNNREVVITSGYYLQYSSDYKV